MNQKSRILSFLKLGEKITELLETEDETLEIVIVQAKNLNPWFTEENIKFSLKSIATLLTKENLENWLTNYSYVSEAKKIGVIMAGNIPLVGFHDFLSVLLSGNKIAMKLSSEDKLLMPYLVEKLIEVDQAFEGLLEINENRLSKDIDAVIATGSNNSARYFEHYFGKYPNIIRKNRNSLALITGNETDEELSLLGEDIFRYYGLGCRNVSKIYVPKGYNLDKIFESLHSYQNVLDHNKYANNYTYQRALLLMDLKPFLDNNFIILQQSSELHSPIGVLNYQFYDNIEEVEQLLKEKDHHIQCLVCNDLSVQFPRKVKLGDAQSPAIDDYADGVDTMAFLTSL